MENSLVEIEQYAKENNVPIIEKEGLAILLEYVEKVKPKSILEIGTAIGYSALQMSTVCDAIILTFEREKSLVDIAIKNIEKFNKVDKIKIIENDFFTYNLGEEKFDFIYVDGAKAQYYNFFKSFEKNMHDKTVVLFDNLSFHGYVNNEEKKAQASKNLKQLIRKLEDFNKRIVVEKGYVFKYINKGDGIGILQKGDHV